MAVMISASVGEGGVNKPFDVTKIDDLLRTVGLLENITPSQQTRNEAIRRFQEIWGLRTKGKFDGKIDPSPGLTLRRLNETAMKPQLSIGMKKIGKGGYKISITPAPPPRPFQTLLGVGPAPGDHFDITGCNPSDVMTSNNLPELLKIINKYVRWGMDLPIKVLVMLNGKLITSSEPQQLPCPVAPHNGKLLPLENGAELAYQGVHTKAKKEYWGRWLQKVQGFDGYFFAYRFSPTGDSDFETKNTNRGFDCITYAGTVCGAPPMNLGETSKLLDYLKPLKCTCTKHVPAPIPGTVPTAVQFELENVKPDEIAEFFKTNTTGYFMMWSGGHVVLVADGVVHEFTPPGGYKVTDVQEWLKKDKDRLSVRKLTAKPTLAV
jgi:hypothetical protein